jgi:hypothetical protein
MAYSFPRPQLVKNGCKDVWNPPRGRPTLANLTREDSAAVWAAINLKLTTALYNAKIFFKDDMVMVWEPKYAPAIDEIMQFTREYRQAVMYMMHRFGMMQSLMDAPRHPCTSKLTGYEESLDLLHIHAKLVVELNMDSIHVKVGRQEDNSLFVEFAWSAAAVAQFEAESVAPKRID